LTLSSLMAISSPEMMLVPVDVSGAQAVGDGRRLRTEVDVTETAATNLAADSVLVADAEVLLLSAWGPAKRCLAAVVTASGVGAYHCRHACRGSTLRRLACGGGSG
jgi:hypothetical protein